MAFLVCLVIGVVLFVVVFSLAYSLEEHVVESYQKEHVTGSATVGQILLALLLGFVCSLTAGISLLLIGLPGWLWILASLLLMPLFISFVIDDAERFAREEWQRREQYQKQQQAKMNAAALQSAQEMRAIANHTVSSFRAVTGQKSRHYPLSQGSRWYNSDHRLGK